MNPFLFFYVLDLFFHKGFLYLKLKLVTFYSNNSHQFTREIFAATRGNEKRWQEDVAVIIEDIKCSASKMEAIFNAEEKSMEIE